MRNLLIRGLAVAIAALAAGLLHAGIAQADPGITVRVSDSPDPVRLTNEVRYFIAVTNSGATTANGVTLDTNTDVPSSMPVTAVSTSLGTCSYDASTYNVHCDFGSMLPGTVINVEIVAVPRVVTVSTVTYGAPRTATRTVTVNSSLGPVSVQETTSIARAVADLVVTHLALEPSSSGFPMLGVTVRNLGFDLATQAAVDIGLPPGWACLPSCRPLFVASMPRGVELHATVFVVPSGTGLFTLTATAYHLPSSFTDDLDTSNNTASIVVDPPGPAPPPPPPPPPPAQPPPPPPVQSPPPPPPGPISPNPVPRVVSPGRSSSVPSSARTAHCTSRCGIRGRHALR